MLLHVILSQEVMHTCQRRSQVQVEDYAAKSLCHAAWRNSMDGSSQSPCFPFSNAGSGCDAADRLGNLDWLAQQCAGCKAG